MKQLLVSTGLLALATAVTSAIASTPAMDSDTLVESLKDLRVQIHLPNEFKGNESYVLNHSKSPSHCRIENVGLIPLRTAEDLDGTFQIAWAADDRLVQGSRVFHQVYLTASGSAELPKRNHILITCQGNFRNPADVVHAISGDPVAQVGWRKLLISAK